MINAENWFIFMILYESMTVTPWANHSSAHYW